MLRRAFLPLCLLILGAAAVVVPLPLFIESPRAPQDLAEVVRVDLADAAAVDGAYLLTAVNLRRAAPVDLVASLFRSDDAFVGLPAVLSPGVADTTFFDEQRAVFASAAEIATAVGLQGAGYEVFAGSGARVLAVVAGSPADGLLAEGDVVVAVDDEPVGTTEDLVAALTAPGAAGRRVLTLQRDGGERSVSVTPRPIDRDAPQIGVSAETAELRIAEPVGVTVDAGRIGGPSAGLMVALTVFDLVDPVDLAAGRRIAGTGTLAPTGAVGPIGGLPSKVGAAYRAGAEVFLVPAVQEVQAREALPTDSAMEVVGVDTFDEAVAALSADRRASLATPPWSAPGG